MPSKVKGNLNQAVVTSITAAEINAGSAARPFTGVQLNNLASQRVLVTGLIWSILLVDPVDAPKAYGPEIIIQRGAVLDPSQNFVQQTEEMVIFCELDRFSDAWSFNSPILLEPGYSYGILLQLAARLNTFVAGAIMSLTVLGQQVSTTGQAQVELR